jgi:hypothetical protein
VDVTKAQSSAQKKSPIEKRSPQNINDEDEEDEGENYISVICTNILEFFDNLPNKLIYLLIFF